MKQWLREIHLSVGDKTWSHTHKGGLDITFDVTKSTNEDVDMGLNLTTITIKNLSKDSINYLRSGLPVILNVGYENNVGNIFVGRVHSVVTYRSGLTKITEITATDGSDSWFNVSYNKSYTNNVYASQIMRDLANTLGYTIAEINPAEDKRYLLGYAVSGKAKDSLRKLVSDTNSKMFVLDNKLYIRSKKDGTKNGFVISSKTGLLNSPERQDDGTYTLETKLNHELILDSYVRIESSTINGNYRILEVQHSSDFVSSLIVKEV